MSIRGLSLFLVAVGILVLGGAVAMWWVNLAGVSAGRYEALSCLFTFSPSCTAANRLIPAALWGGLLTFLVGLTMLLALSSDASEPSRGLRAVIGVIDTFTDLTGSLIAWMSVPLVAAVAYEVFSRYLFNAPTIWSFDITYMLYGALFMLGAAYALHKGAHIRTDFFWEAFSPRKKGLIDSISYIVFFFPSLTILMLISWHETEYAFRIGETSDQTPWRPILWPFKGIVPLACLLLMIQGFSELLKSLYMARTGVELEQKEKVEV